MTKQFVITGRFHTVTFCLLTGTPFVAIPSNTSKIEALLIDVFGNASRLISPEEINAAKVLDILDSELLAFSQDEVEIISSYTSQAQDSTTSMFEEISSLIADS